MFASLREMVADSRRDLPHFLDHAEIERAPPHERLDRVEEALAERDVAGRGAGADEGRALPRQRAAIRNARSRHSTGSAIGVTSGEGRSRRSTRCDIAVLGPLLQNLDQPPADAHRRLPGIVARAPGQGRRVEQQQQVDVGRIIELAAAELAHGDDREAARLGVRHPLRDRGRDRLVDRPIGEIGQQAE